MEVYSKINLISDTGAYSQENALRTATSAKLVIPMNNNCAEYQQHIWLSNWFNCPSTILLGMLRNLFLSLSITYCLTEILCLIEMHKQLSLLKPEIIQRAI